MGNASTFWDFFCYIFFSWCFKILKSIFFLPLSCVKLVGYFGSYKRFLRLVMSTPLSNGICKSETRLDGKTVVITGCTSGIGKENAIEFYKRGSRVIMCCLSTEEAKVTVKDIRKECIGMKGLGTLVYTILDLASLDSVRQCAENILATENSIHILVNNAGIIMNPKSKTVDGFESHFGVNYLGHFLFTLILLPLMIKSKPARIINVSSNVHVFGALNFDDLHFENTEYCCFKAYTQSKLAVLLFTKELAIRLKANKIDEIAVHAVHPGVLCTRLGPHFDELLTTGASWIWYMVGRVALKNFKSGAQTTLHCALDESCAKGTGQYYCDCSPQIPSEEAQDPVAARKLWKVSCKMVGFDVNRNDRLSQCYKLLKVH